MAKIMEVYPARRDRAAVRRRLAHGGPARVLQPQPQRGTQSACEFTKSFGVPTLVLGWWGVHDPQRGARCWAYETSVLLGTKGIPIEVPYNDYFEYYAPDYKLHLTPEPRENMNTEASLNSVRTELLQQLQDLQGAPSVQMQEVPPEFDLQKEKRAEGQYDGSAEDEVRQGTKEGRKEHEAEFYDQQD